MIKLPAKRRCGECDGTGEIVMGPDENRAPCKYCEDGYRYDFDDLAAAVREAVNNYEVPNWPDGIVTISINNTASGECYAEIAKAKDNVSGDRYHFNTQLILASGVGKGDTAALLAAIEKYNAEENDG